MTRLEKFADYGLLDETWFDSLVDEHARRVQVPATYVVFKEGTKYYAEHCKTSGSDIAGSTNPISVIQSAMDALTAGRTHKECVVVKGVIEITDAHAADLPLQIPSYTILDLSEAKILDSRSQVADDGGDHTADKWKNFIENADRSGGNSHITIYVGETDGQRGSIAYQDEQSQGYNEEGNFILWEKVDDSEIIGGYIKRWAGNAVGTNTCNRNFYFNITAKDCGGYGQFEETTEIDGGFKQCKALNSASELGADGFNWCTTCKNLVFVGCIARNNSYGGFFRSCY